MNAFIKWLLIALLLTFSITGRADFDGIEDAISVLLVSQRADDVKLGARIINNEGISNQALLDHAAQRFAIYFEHSERLDAQHDTLAWLARILGETENARYRLVLEQGLSRTGMLMSKGNAEKVDRYIRTALSSLQGTSEPFVPASMSLDELRESVLSVRSPGSPETNVLDQVTEGETVASVYRKYGVPTNVLERRVSKRYPFVGRINHQLLEFQYVGAGAIRFKRAGGVWQVEQFTHLEDTDQLAISLSSDDPAVFRAAAQKLHKAQQYSEELLDLAAETAWNNIHVTDRVGVDAVAWLCNYLGFSGNPRYRHILEEIMAATPNAKLKKYAKRALDKLEAIDIEQFSITDVLE